jgi:hypothetical protein
MKQFYFLLLSIICASSSIAQINTGGLQAGFGVDADTRASYKKYGPSGNYSASDDWFAITGLAGKAVIDTTNASKYLTQLQNNKNISFVQRMSAPAYSNVNGRLWLDAVYTRDYIDASGTTKDSTSFTSARNAENPASWDAAPKALDPANDIVDAYAHLRRNGHSANDSLWLFAAVSTVEKTANRYLDIELFNKNLSYNKNTKKFTSAGTALGHTPWLFDLTGKVTQTGDVLITIIHESNQKPRVDIQIWVSKLTYNLSKPSLFNFGTIFQEGSSNATYGYANILPKSSTIKTGAAISNYSSNANADTTFSTPWGTIKPTGTWSQTYQSRQFAEVGLNLTRIGLDPASYLATSVLKCTSIFQSVIFKSGDYNTSFGSDYDYGGGCSDNNNYFELEDFAGPFNFSTPALNYTVSADTITCKNPVATLTVNNHESPGLFTLSTNDGQILGPVTSNTLTIDKQGTYYVTGSLAPGCPNLQTLQVDVVADMIPPVVTADIGLTPDGEIQLLGGDATQSSVLTPFGSSKGLKWDWKGPNGFRSSEQNPMIDVDWAWGSYYLTVEELRNGCTASISLDISFKNEHKDEKPTLESNTQTESSNTLMLSPNTTTKTNYVWRNAANRLMLITNQETVGEGTILIHNVNGQLVGTKNVNLSKGLNNIELPVSASAQVKIVSFYVDKKLMLTQKIY